MIRINLLKYYATIDSGEGFYGEEDEKKKIYIDFLKRLVVILIGPLAFYLYETAQIPEYKDQIVQLTAKIADLKQFNDKKKGLAEEIKKYEEDQNKLNAQMNFMRKVSNEKINELKLFLYLQSHIPESVWINKLELKGTELSLSVESDISGEITKFLEQISASPFLSAVSVLNQESRPDGVGPGMTTTVYNVKAIFTSEAAAQ